MKKTLSFENSKMQKKLTHVNTNISNKKESRNNVNSFNKSEKDYNSDDNQTSTKCLKLSSKNTLQITSDNIEIFSSD